MTKNETIELAIALIKKNWNEYLLKHPNNDEADKWMVKQHEDAIAILESMKDAKAGN